MTGIAFSIDAYALMHTHVSSSETKQTQALAFLAEATGTTNDGTATDSGGDPQALSLPPLAAALAARLGFHRTGLRLLAGMHRGLGGGWEAVAAAVEEAVLAEDA